MGFGADLAKVVRAAQGNVGRIVTDGVLGMLNDMTERAPVDTGTLRANMQVGIDAINRDTSAPPGSDPVARGRGVLASWKPGQTIYLSNMLPYAAVVEYGLYGKPPGSANGPKTIGGYSKRSQGGYARLAAQAWADRVREAAEKLP